MKFSVIYQTFLFTGVASAFSPTIPTSKVTSTCSIPRFAVDDKAEVREYFNTEGFNRWNKIYSDSDEVNGVQMDIRDGHAQTIDKILNWVRADGDIRGKTVCDCGCGVGSLAIPLAKMGTYDKGELILFDLEHDIESKSH
jgi:magnesium-protoporphyrin O-methyltransferase